MNEVQVLLVDDSPVVRMVVSKQIESLGVKCDLAEDGADAVSAFEKKQYALIFMDVMMPKMDGLEATKQIRTIEQNDEKRRRTAIVGVTGYTDRAACIKAGMDDFLFKPVSIGQLRGALKLWIENIDLPAASDLGGLLAESDKLATESEIAEERIAALKVKLGFDDGSLRSTQ